MANLLRKTRKLVRNPLIYLRDLLLKRHPLVLNEVGTPVTQEQILIQHEADLHRFADNALEIDVVYTWVDDADPAWRQRMLQAKSETCTQTLGRYALDNARFANHDEIKFSLEGVRRFMPWVRRIYVVTDQQRPSWLENTPDVHIVDHREIIEPQFLPTFNSHVIEACLHRIPGLSEQFIYFNDDVFSARPLSKSHFFRSNGIASLFLTQKSLRAMKKKGFATPTLSASMLGAELLRKQYGVLIDTPLTHTYVPLKKSIFEMVWKVHSAEIERFLSNKFRGTDDLNLPTFLVPWTAYFEGKAVPATNICYYFNVRSAAAETQWRQLLAQKHATPPHSFCANDFNDSNYKEVHGALHQALSAYFDKT